MAHYHSLDARRGVPAPLSRGSLDARRGLEGGGLDAGAGQRPSTTSGAAVSEEAARKNLEMCSAPSGVASTYSTRLGVASAFATTTSWAPRRRAATACEAGRALEDGRRTARHFHVKERRPRGGARARRASWACRGCRRQPWVLARGGPGGAGSPWGRCRESCGARKNRHNLVPSSTRVESILLLRRSRLLLHHTEMRTAQTASSTRVEGISCILRDAPQARRGADATRRSDTASGDLKRPPRRAPRTISGAPSATGS